MTVTQTYSGQERRRSVLMFLILFSAPSALLAAPSGFDDGLIEGAHGILHVAGTMTESACRLDMASVDQTIEIGNVGSGELRHPGYRAAPVAVKFILRDCIRHETFSRDILGGVSWSTTQPTISVTFTGIADADNPQLIQVRGASGMGLRLTDSSHHNVTLGQLSPPQFLSPGSEMLTYYVVPERTASPFAGGAFSANVNFRLNYD